MPDGTVGGLGIVLLIELSTSRRYERRGDRNVIELDAIRQRHRGVRVLFMSGHNYDTAIRGILALMIPASPRPEVEAEVLAEQARDMLSARRQGRVQRRGDQHFDDRPLRPDSGPAEPGSAGTAWGNRTDAGARLRAGEEHDSEVHGGPF